MRAALAVRDQVLLKSTLQQVQSSAASSTNPDAVFKIDIFLGDFLDTRSSIVFGVFLGVGAFFFAFLRAYAPPLMIMSIFGTIGLDIFCTFGPLFPFGQYTLLNSLLISVAMYIAIAVVVIVLVFPETMNHAFLHTVSELLTHMSTILKMQDDVLSATPGDFAADSPKLAKLRGTRLGMISKQQQLATQSKFLGAEFSWGRWNGEDAKGLEEPLLAVSSRINGLMSFVRYSSRRERRDSESPDRSTSSVNTTSTADGATTADTYLIRQMYQRNAAAEAAHSLGLLDVLPLIRRATADLRAACIAGVSAVQAFIDYINKNRYARGAGAAAAEHTRALDEAAERLAHALEQFKTSGRLVLLEPYKPLLAGADTFDARTRVPLRGLYVGYVFGASLIAVTEAVLALMDGVRATASKRSANRLWAPRSLRAVAGVLLSKRGDGKDFGEEEKVEEVKIEEAEERSYARDPDSRPPTNAIQRVMHVAHNVYAWTRTAEAVFIFKYTLITILLYLPAVFKSSAHIYYAQKGVWALIMAQTTLNIYAGDQLFNYVVRLGGTFIGLVIGLVVWYLGNAKSNGNPYGLAASVGVFLIPLLFMRLFSPAQYTSGVILMCATVVLIVGYSWIDGHLPTVSSPGIGWPIAWRRWTLVTIGSAASFIVMMFPPQSGRKAVRLRNAATIAGLSHVYIFLMSAWIAGADGTGEEGTQSQGSGEKLPLGKGQAGGPASGAPWVQEFRRKLVGVVQQIQTLQQMTALARWEGNVRGAWPYKEYNRLAEVQMDMVASLAQLAGALSKLAEDRRLSMVHHTAVVNPNFIADAMSVFALVSQALRTGEPLHAVLPQNLLDRLIYHHVPVARAHSSARAKETAEGGEEEGEGRGLVHVEALGDLDYMFYASAVIAVIQLLEGLDEVHRLVRELCGEVPFAGFAGWRESHQRVHIAGQGLQTPRPVKNWM